MKLQLFYILVIAYFSDCSPVELKPPNEDTDLRIVGGVPEEIENRPFQVSLQYYYRHLCGGSIISNRWVISAAHCTQIVSVQPPLFAFTIRMGSPFVQSEGRVFGVSRIIDHPLYGNTDNQFAYDITVIQVSQEIPFGSTMQPISLPPADAPEVPGATCVVSGWGALTQGGSIPIRLHSVRVPLISLESCNQYYHNIFGMDYITYDMLCAGSPYGGRDACQGDSGGPLTIDGVLMGIVAWGYGCAQPNYPGVYTNVAVLRQWVNSATGL